MDSKHSISLSELSQLISDVVDVELSDSIWVRAEISSLSVKNGHAYIELVEKGEDELFAAKMRATCWKNVYSQLAPYFLEETARPLSVGMQVLLEGYVSYHAVYGFSFVITDIDPTFTLGDIARTREQTLRQLEKDGVMALQSELPFPSLPKRIAVISSSDAAGYQDFQDQLLANTYGFAFSTTLFPAIMQGDKAAQSIVEAIEKVAEKSNEFDTLVIIRGGGANTDLGCFDDYNLCYVAAQMPLPILTGIGHTRDVSVLDKVVYQPLKTPTAVAGWLVERRQEQLELLESLAYRLSHFADHIVLARQRQLDGLSDRLARITDRYLLNEQHRLQMMEHRLQSCSPEKIFAMGYSLTYANGHILKDKHDAPQGTVLTTYLATGIIVSKVKE